MPGVKVARPVDHQVRELRDAALAFESEHRLNAALRAVWLSRFDIEDAHLADTATSGIGQVRRSVMVTIAGVHR